jgi:asparagine synthetase B (glutamine-hydrolysing)
MDESFAVASRLDVLLMYAAGLRGRINHVAIAELAASLFAVPHDTVYVGVFAVAAGWTVRWAGQNGVTPWRHWEIPTFLAEGRAHQSLDDAAAVLGDLLRDACRERLSPAGVTATHLSGGWDSSAVFATSASLLEAEGSAGRSLAPITARYPVGDSGDETNFVQSILDRHHAVGTWLPGPDIPFDVNGLGHAPRVDPFVHPFAGFNDALAAAAAASAAHVVFTGWGALREAHHQFRRFGGRDWRGFVALGVLPLFPEGLRRTLARSLGVPPTRYLAREIPQWVRADFTRRHGLATRQNAHLDDARGRAVSDWESRTLVSHGYFPRVYAEVASLNRSRGVEVRAPLFDERVVRFAAARPRRDRTNNGETKILLRQAMRDLLPPEVLAPRESRTGTLDTYLEQSFQRHAALLDELLPPTALSDLGIVDPAAFGRFAATARSDPAQFGVQLTYALQVERWLRGC